MHTALSHSLSAAARCTPVVDKLSTAQTPATAENAGLNGEGEIPNRSSRASRAPHAAATKSAARTATGPDAEPIGARPASDEYVWPLGVSAAPADEYRLDCATPGDHASIHQLLTSVFRGPSRDDFAAALEDPHYEPKDRLVVRRGSQVLAQVHLAERVLQLGPHALPASILYRLAVMPEYRGRGFGAKLLARAESAMRADGSLLGVLTTRIPHYFRRHGWVACIRHSHAQVGARDVLAQLSARGFTPQVVDDELNIRPWRHVELPSLVRIYNAAVAGSHGPCQRTEAYWRWLVNRHAADGLLVALAGPNRFDFDVNDHAIVGYAIVRDDRVLELAAAPGCPGVKERLLARACGEAIERDHHVVQVNLAPDDSLWEVMQAAGCVAHRTESYQGEVTMVRLFDPVGYLRRLLPTLHDRAHEARLKRPLALSLMVDDLSLRITISRRSVKVVRAAPGRCRLRISEADFTRLLLGHLDIEQAAAEGRVGFTQRQALQAAKVLFPQLPLWRPPLDDLLV